MKADIFTTRILILDDDPFILKLLMRMLANMGFSSVICCWMMSQPGPI